MTKPPFGAAPPPAATSRLEFRRLTAADAPFILKLVNEPGWLAHIGDRNIHDLAAAAAYVANGPAMSHARHGFGLDCVILSATGEAIGMAGLLQRATLSAPDIGYAFLQAHHGQGYATEAAGAVLQHARTTLSLNTLHALTAPDNAASIRVLEKLGFKLQQAEFRSEHGEISRLFVCHLEL